MIGRLHGRVVSELSDGTVVLDVHGVGYELTVPAGTLGRCVRDEGGAVTLTVVTHVREDAIMLFGFAGESDRAVFRLLTSVAGVGPRIAVNVLGALPSGELATAVARGDARRLQAVPGVGKRIAERLVLELKDKLTAAVLNGAPGSAVGFSEGAAAGASTVHGAQSGAAGAKGALVTTLIHLGFKPAEAERAAAELAPRAAEPLDALVRAALKGLVR